MHKGILTVGSKSPMHHFPYKVLQNLVDLIHVLLI